jgi:hypothetical protein
MKRHRFLAATVLAISNPSQLMAGPNAYQCKIVQVVTLSAKGVTEPATNLFGDLVGARFSIDRRSGAMIGLPFDTRYWPDVVVLDPGSSDQSYKALIKSRGPNVNVMYIYVKEYHKGPLKPFLGSSDDNVYSGLCE